ncbi:MAG: cyclic beta 1-2 glucan synthetase [Bacteroidetes bacterium]|nr:cyclic beta 1-2 glucan synthetase [Bacteroidota bacterium]
MRNITHTVYELLLSLRSHFLGAISSQKTSHEEPLRSELYNSWMMKQHGERVASMHAISKTRGQDRLLKRLNNNEKILLEVRNLLVEAVKEKRNITPASEWLLDNFYLIEEQISIGRKHLPKGYSQDLPILTFGNSAKLPRVYDIALEIISHSDGRMDIGNLSSFIESYQLTSKLTIGELWAIPIMLRLALIENLRRIATRIAIDRIDINLAGYWSNEFKKTAENKPKDLIFKITEMARSMPSLSSAFVSEFSRELQVKGPTYSLLLNWLEQQLAEIGDTVGELIIFENQKQAADQVSISNSIKSLRLLSTTEWKFFVENLSEVNNILSKDIDGVYKKMDFATRDHYRHVIENIAKKSRFSETDIAEMALNMAIERNEQGAPVRERHVGYFLIDEGLYQIQRAAQVKFSWKDKINRFFKKVHLQLYAGSIILLTIVLVFFTSFYFSQFYTNLWIIAGIVFLSFVGLSQFATWIINWITTLLVKPKPLPKMDFSKAIPSQCYTMVAIPSMLGSIEMIDELTEALEVRYLANPNVGLVYALLTDLTDAPEQHLPGDDALINHARQSIENLNKKYEQTGRRIFYLFHRNREWNNKEKKWIGYERKRGKLAALNAFLRNKQHSFSVIAGNLEALPFIKYIITLDADTQLPRETAIKLISAMAHPLSIPVYSSYKKRIVKGYGILQPRVSASLPRANSSWYAKIHSYDSGLDPYTRITSDVYQDLFAEGSFIGKGIYDIDAFEKVLGNRLPENRVLSHDLLEGSYLRCGLVSDVQLYEDYPEKYFKEVSRRHRWVRGDWQIASWALPISPDINGKLSRNHLSGLSHWKILDNLRRSLVAPALVILLVFGWLIMPHPVFWTCGLVLVFILPTILNSFWQLIHPPKELEFIPHLKETGKAFLEMLYPALFNIAILPFEAYYNTDAIIRTNWRLIFSRRKLLEWTPSHNHKYKPIKSLGRFYLVMWICPFIILLVTGFAIQKTMYIIFYASPVLVLWLLAPLIAWVISKPGTRRIVELAHDDLIYLRKLSRKTWAYFEDFINEKNNYLPPDNYQVHPVEVLANRTSPTNIGLALLCRLSAVDFGYITLPALIHGTRATFDTMEKMERFRGHFYNWYDTISLQPLNPKYISAVDSGNMAGYLMVLKQGLLSSIHQPIICPEIFIGLKTTVQVIQENIKENESMQISLISKKLDETIEECPATLFSYHDVLQTISGEIKKWENHFPEIIQHWIQKLRSQVQDYIETLKIYAPWIEMPNREALMHFSFFSKIPTWSELANALEIIHLEIENFHSTHQGASMLPLPDNAEELIQEGALKAVDLLSTIQVLVEDCTMYADIEFDFLYDRSNNLMHIGYNVDAHEKDRGYYDLLASEARLGVFIGIAQGKLPQESWFALGRLLTYTRKSPVLLSWSGSMFEYLMPQLIMPTYVNTLIEQTNQSMVQRQIDYGHQRNVPWGISESGYNMVDSNLNYQYRAFGVPDLGLKRGLSDDLVIAPYASILALMIKPHEALQNLQSMSRKGFVGKYGFYEAMDYTSSRLPRGKDHVPIFSFMVHHLGMSFLSLATVIQGQQMQKRFEDDPQLQSAILLLQERIPRASIFYAHTADIIDTKPTTSNPQLRIIHSPQTIVPEVQLLSNGRYNVAITNSGGGYSRWNNISVNRWREDGILDNKGTFCYIKDISTGEFWSNTFQPTLKKSKNYEAIFSQGHAEFKRFDNGFETRTEIVVSPEDDLELRRIRVINKNGSIKKIRVSSFAEVVIAPQAADEAHPAFSNLFVQTKIYPNQSTIICTRRPKSNEEKPPWMFHLVTADGIAGSKATFETDRAYFIGRGRTVINPKAMDTDFKMRGVDGSVLDPCVSISYEFELKPNQTATFDIITGMADSKELCESLMYKYQDKFIKNRAFELSWTHNQVILHQINASEGEAQLYVRMAGSIIFPNALLRATPEIIKSNFKGQNGLWSYSISGDLPIVLLRVHDIQNLPLVNQMIKAHAYWRMKGIAVDLLILNEDFGAYRQELQEQIMNIVTASVNTTSNAQPGNLYVRRTEQVTNEDRILFQTVARIIIDDHAGTLEEQINNKVNSKPLPPAFLPTINHPGKMVETPQLHLPADLVFVNGHGGFTKDGKEYIIYSDAQKRTPAPWANVLANYRFGTVISESGSSYSWLENAHEFRLTPWHNDPVSDSSGEAFFIRDEEDGKFWSPMPLPATSKEAYITRHGFGYSVFEHIENGIQSETTVFVHIDKPVKFTSIRLKNLSGRERKLSVTGYAEWILGDLRSKSSMYIITEKDAETGALFSKNRYNSIFFEQVCFFTAHTSKMSFTCDRSEFIGSNGSMQSPAAMGRIKLSGKNGASMDACAAIQIPTSLYAGEEKEIIFRLGAGNNEQEVQNIIETTKDPIYAQETLQKVHEFWNETLGAVKVETPDNALNFLTNGWLVYQALACRVWGRSGYYQSGGAFGFRDQLQDVMALLHTKPQVARDQIILSASRQFKEGDVQHWWHPPTGRGVRTRCSDDYLWLPFVTNKYIELTEDWEILQESVSFIEGRPLNMHEDSYYDLPVYLNYFEPLYNHCKLAIQHGLRFGAHGLPLIGSGDWNDGMDRVGNEGRGESVWLAFFLYTNLNEFAKIAHHQNDHEFAEECLQQAKNLKENIAKNAWDGDWYRRAYFDDGTPLGSIKNKECRIDSISQSWSILSQGGTSQRSTSGMKAVDKFLVDRTHRLIKLLDPAFDTADLDPGYIKGYVPGVRENGGQYTHAAIWTMMAFAALGENEKVWELFSLINPVDHSHTEALVQQYKAEPYVLVADIYSTPGHEGRGGWSWYTGSAGWMYQFILEFMLGLKREGDKLLFHPCIPDSWDSFSINYQYEKTTYHINFINRSDQSSLHINGKKQEKRSILLEKDAGTIEIEFHINGAKKQTPLNEQVKEMK